MESIFSTLIFIFMFAFSSAKMNVSFQYLSLNHQVKPTNFTRSDLVQLAHEWDRNFSIFKKGNYCNCSALLNYISDSTLISETAYIKSLVEADSSFFNEFHEGDCVTCLYAFGDQSSKGPEKAKNKHPALYYIFSIGAIISLVALLFHLVLFIVVPNVKNMPSYCLASLCVSILIGHTIFLAGNAQSIKASKVACLAVASIAHLFILSSLMWTNVIAFTIYISLFRSASRFLRPSTKFSLNKFCKFAVYGWGISFVFVVIALLNGNVYGLPIGYLPPFSKGTCWFSNLRALWIFFIGPAFVVIVINAVLFALSVYTINRNRMMVADAQQNEAKTYLVTYSKLALIMGVHWLLMISARVTNDIVLWYLFAISQSLQGSFIFLGFSCTTNHRKYIIEKIRITKKSSPVSDTAFYTNSSHEYLSSSAGAEK